MLIKQKTNNIDIPKLDMPTMHGHTKIELKNVKTGLKEVIESDNTFQGAMIAKYLRSLGTNAIINFPEKSANNTYPLWRKVVGGLFLFRDSIAEGNQYMPAGNSMIGAGVVGMTHTGAPTEWGSYNETESSSSMSAITQIYDFATDQANGTISSVCLTSRAGALIGYGHNGDDYLGHYNNEPVSSYASEQYPIGWLFKDSNNKEWCLSLGNSESSYYQIYNGKMLFTKQIYGVNKASVFNTLYKEISIDLTAITNPFNITSTSYGYISIFPMGGTKFGIIPSSNVAPSSIAAGGTVNYYEFDADTETLLVKSFLNPLSEAISYADSNGQGTISFTKDGCAIVRGYTSRTLFKINLSGVIEKSFGDTIDFAGNYAAPNGGCYGQDVVPGLQLFNGKGTSYNQNAFVYDKTADTIKRINIAYTTRNCYNAELDLCEYNMARYTGGVSGNGNYCMTNPLYLATINNLQTPVTKTAAQTMKVTYTLTEV